MICFYFIDYNILQMGAILAIIANYSVQKRRVWCHEENGSSFIHHYKFVAWHDLFHQTDSQYLLDELM